MASIQKDLDRLTDIYATMAQLIGDLTTRVIELEEKVEKLEGEK